MIRRFDKKNKWKDPLTNRIRRQIKYLLECSGENNDDLGLEGLQFVVRQSVPTVFRFIWAIAILLCISICSYQIYTRVLFYLSYPIVIDVHINKNDTIYFPSFTACTQATKAFFEFSNKWNLMSADDKFLCNGLQDIMISFTGPEINSSYLWTNIDIEPEIISLNYVVNKTAFTKGAYDKITQNLGVCGVFETATSDPVKYGGFGSKLELVLRHTKGTCERITLWISIHDRGIITDGKNYVSISPGIVLDLAIIKIKQYKFLNSPNKHCMENEEFETCYWNKAFDDYDQKIPCRFPFVPFSSNDLEECASRNNASRHFLGAFKLTLEHSINKISAGAKCYRKCNLNLYDINEQFLEDKQMTSIISTSIRDNHVTIISERLAYNIIDLFCDMGGNIGLYLGMSVLSIFQVAMELFKLWRKRNRNLFAKDIIFRKVKKLFQKELIKPMHVEEELSVKLILMFNDRSALCRLILFVICCIAFSIQMYQLLIMYFSYPTKVVVNVEQNKTIYFPDITYCYDRSSPSLRYRKKVAKLLDTEPCDPRIQLPDMVLEGKAEAVWNSTYPKNQFKEVMNMGSKSKGNFELFVQVKFSKIYLTEGQCRLSQITPSVYRGTNSIYPIIADPVLCDNITNFKMFVSAPGEEIDLKSMRILPNAQRVLVVFTAKEVWRLNTPTNPCLTTEEYRECRAQCLRAKVLKSIYCRLPYLEEPTLPMCENASSAWDTHKVYMDFALYADLQRHCGCHRLCKEVIYETRLETTGLENRIVMVAHIFAHNYVEIMEEISTYPIIKFLCDMGGNLGLALGMSTLSLFNFIQMFLRMKRGKTAT